MAVLRVDAPIVTPFTTQQQHILTILVPIFSALGMLGALATLFSGIYFRHLRTTTARVIFGMAMADLIGISAKSLGRVGPSFGGALCQSQAALMQYGDLASILWTAIVSCNLLFVMLLDKAVSQLRQYEAVYILAAFLVPVPFAVVPLFIGIPDPSSSSGWLNMYGDADLWCWIEPTFSLARLLLFYLPLWVVFLFNLVTYGIVGRKIWAIAARVYARHGPNAAVHDRKYHYGRCISLYLVAFLITWTPSTINRLYAFVYPTQPSFVLTILMAICSPARGLTNFAVYFYLTWFSQIKWESTRGGVTPKPRRVDAVPQKSSSSVEKDDCSTASDTDSDSSSMLSDPNADRSDISDEEEKLAKRHQRTSPPLDILTQPALEYTPPHRNRCDPPPSLLLSNSSYRQAPLASFSGGGVVFAADVLDDDAGAVTSDIDLNETDQPPLSPLDPVARAGAGHDIYGNSLKRVPGGNASSPYPTASMSNRMSVSSYNMRGMPP